MFDIKKHLIKIQGNRPYLPVAARLVWFRQDHPDWGIDTHLVTLDLDRQFAVFEASVYNADGKLMAKGTKGESIRGFSDYIEKSETGAIGRALAVCGYGTQFAPDLDETSSADSFQSYNLSQSQNGNGYDHARGDQSANGSRPDRAAAAPGREPAQASCSDCGREITRSQVTFSERRFGRPLCPNCQKERRPAEQTG